MRELIKAAIRFLMLVAAFAATCNILLAEVPRELRVGRAGHAFDHLGVIGNQAAAAAASGATIIYAGGLGAPGYEGLPSQSELIAQRAALTEYNREAKQQGIELAIGYLCATSIVRLETFDNNWSDAFREKFKTPPAEWQQMDRQGNYLASWYGGDYHPACMNNPDWRTYEEFLVRQTLETGHDGIFFDNPTVHAQGCYCPHCMDLFAIYLQQHGVAFQLPTTDSPERIEEIRQLADTHPKEFLRFRATTARDFLAHIRNFAHTINPRAFITCNNSLNSPNVLYAQSRSMAYNIEEMSKAEDFVVVEDMATQPRTDANGQTLEYGPTYKQLHAISHGKPVVACALVGGDYHTAPNLVRLAMAEAVAHNASYLSWPTWPEDQRQQMIGGIRPQADFLREHEGLLNDAPFRADVVIFAPFRRWVDTDQCAASTLAAALTSANIQYRVQSEDNYDPSHEGKSRPLLLIESRSVLSPEELTTLESFTNAGGRVVTAELPNWLKTVQELVVNPALEIKGPSTVRAIVHDQPSRSIVHLYNLNVERLTSFADRVTPAADIQMKVRVPFKARKVSIQTADEQGTKGSLKFTTEQDGDENVLTLTIPRIEISAIIVIEAISVRP